MPSHTINDDWSQLHSQAWVITDSLRFIPDAPCSIHKYAEDCNQSCGYGSPTGRCSMVQQGSSSNDTMRTIPVYQTCTAHPETCPDGHCDELEMMFPFICFQDCTGMCYQCKMKSKSVMTSLVEYWMIYLIISVFKKLVESYIQQNSGIINVFQRENVCDIAISIFQLKT